MRIDSATTAIFGAQPVMKTAKSEAAVSAIKPLRCKARSASS